MALLQTCIDIYSLCRLRPMSVTLIPANMEPPALTSLMTLSVPACQAGQERLARIRQTFAPHATVTMGIASICRSHPSAGKLLYCIQGTVWGGGIARIWPQMIRFFLN